MNALRNWSVVTIGLLLGMMLVSGASLPVQAQTPSAEASWDAYFAELGEKMIASDETELEFTIDRFELMLDSEASEVSGNYQIALSDSAAKSGFLVWIYPSTEAAEDEVSQLLADFESGESGEWTEADDPELGDDSGCYTGDQDGDGVGFCYLREGDTIVAALSGMEGDTSDSALESSLETASELIQVVPGALDEVDRPEF